jgi:REP element-mobilizing transposase RayT
MTFRSLHDPTYIYFVTATVCSWQPLFAEPTYARIVLDSLAWLRRRQRMALFAFVLMPSHLHALVKPEDRTIGELLQTFGSFTAHRILRQLREDSCQELLALFCQQRRDSRHGHSLWQDIQAKNIHSVGFLRQKLEYIHNNPLQKQDRTSMARADYPYTSALFYDRGLSAIIPLDDIREWL